MDSKPRSVPVPLILFLSLGLLISWGCASDRDRASPPGYTPRPVGMNGNGEEAGVSGNGMSVAPPATEQGKAPGGFEEIPTDREDVEEVFLWLEEELERTGEPIYSLILIKAEIQVVAGYNYRLACSYSTSPEVESGTQLLEALIYKRLDGVCVLKDISCGDD